MQDHEPHHAGDVVDHHGRRRTIEAKEGDGEVRVCRSQMQDTDGRLLLTLTKLRIRSLGRREFTDIVLTEDELDELVRALLWIGWEDESASDVH
jgi:hypothetical protein